MTDKQLLMSAIIANPDDDTPRLMYADEIELAEPERAEFIRVQCELAHPNYRSHIEWSHVCEFPKCRICEMLKCQDELWKEHAHKWTVNILQYKPVFVRGFLDKLECSSDEVWTVTDYHMGRAIDSTPWIRAVITKYPTLRYIQLIDTVFPVQLPMVVPSGEEKDVPKLLCDWVKQALGVKSNG